jgi:hypothetical protein
MRTVSTNWAVLLDADPLGLAWRAVARHAVVGCAFASAWGTRAEAVAAILDIVSDDASWMPEDGWASGAYHVLYASPKMRPAPELEALPWANEPWDDESDESEEEP